MWQRLLTFLKRITTVPLFSVSFPMSFKIVLQCGPGEKKKPKKKQKNKSITLCIHYIKKRKQQSSGEDVQSLSTSLWAIIHLNLPQLILVKWRASQKPAEHVQKQQKFKYIKHYDIKCELLQLCVANSILEWWHKCSPAKLYPDTS